MGRFARFPATGERRPNLEGIVDASPSSEEILDICSRGRTDGFRSIAMPNYDYFCQKCKATFEVFQSMKDEPFAVCPESACLKAKWGKGRVERQLGTGAGLLFKGSGFYITDYRSENYKTAAKKESGAAEPAKKSGGGDAPAKSTTPASPPASKPAATANPS